MCAAEDPPSPRFQFSIRFLLGLTAVVAVTCAFASSAGWWMLILVVLSYLFFTGYLLVFVFWWQTLSGASRTRPKLLGRLSTTKLVVGWLVFMWLLLLLLVGLFSRKP